MKFPARVESVFIYNYGAEVSADTAAGATVIPASFPSDFDEDGGSLTRTPIDATVTDSTVYAYKSVDIDAETITLSAATTVAFAAGDMLYVDPSVNEARALVRLSDSEDEAAVECRIEHALRSLLAEGTRDPGTGESVLVELVGHEWVVTDVVGETPVMDGSVIDPATLPASGAKSDGNPPASSPTPTVRGGIGTLFVQWTAITNADPVTYEVHVSTTSGFTPSSTTKAAELAGTLVVLSNAPDGTALQYGTTYYVCTIAKDADGSAPASAQASDHPVQATTNDIAAGAITANELAANAVVAGKIAAGAIDGTTITGALIRTAASGGRVVLDGTADTFEIYASDGSKIRIEGGTKNIIWYDATGNVIRQILGGATDLIYESAGKLASSYSPVAGTDQFGNNYQAGFTSYNTGSGAYTHIHGGGGLFLNNDVIAPYSGGLVTLASGFDNATAGSTQIDSPMKASTDVMGSFSIQSGPSGAWAKAYFSNTQVIVPKGIYAARSGANGLTYEDWQNITPINGFTDNSSNGTGCRVAMTPIGVGGVQWVCLNLNIQAPSTIGTAIIGVVPAAYIPASGQNIEVTSSKNTGSGAQTPHVFIDTSGNIKTFGVSASAVIGCLGMYPIA